ncbi:MAG TPA: hypothetical protein VGB82_07535 [Alphaproteobacteria bacterium]
MMHSEPEACAGIVRVRAFVDHFTLWMKETSAAGRDDPTLAASLVDLMKGRLEADLDDFIEAELRLRAFERRAPDQEPFLQLIDKAG